MESVGRWEPFTDRELRDIYLALATAPTAGNPRTNTMVDEIIAAANSRGDARALAILRDDRIPEPE